MTEEIWKPVAEYENYYHVSNLGRIKSIQKEKNNGRCMCKKQETIRSLTENKSGYLYITFKVNGEVKTKSVHRIVAKAFIPEILDKKEVNHKNGIKNDNRVENLEWCTRSENQLHSYSVGLNPGTKGYTWIGKKGKEHCASKVVLQFNRSGELVKEWGGTREIERELGFNHGNISLACRGKISHSNGFIWKYK